MVSQNSQPKQTQRGGGTAEDGNVMSLKTLREKFQRYLTLLFHDLCAKTNGLTKKEIDEYTFMKVIYIFNSNYSIHNCPVS